MAKIFFIQAQDILYNKGGVVLTERTTNIGTQNCGLQNIGIIYKLHYELENTNSFQINIDWWLASIGAPPKDRCFGVDFITYPNEGVKKNLEPHEKFSANVYELWEKGIPEPYWFIHHFEEVKKTLPPGNNNVLQNLTNSKDSTATRQKNPFDYSTYPDADLQKAMKEEKNIDYIQMIQKELDKRKPLNEFDKYNNLQLKDLLDTYIAKEDYDSAERIKNEVANRKKTVDNLKILLKNAVQKEDFEKAAGIQEKIKKMER